MVKEVYHITNKFPNEERFGLTSQLRRATISIRSNLAEGSARKTAKHQAHFTANAYGSLMEVLNQLIFSADLDFMKEDKLSSLRPKIEELGNKLNSL